MESTECFPHAVRPILAETVVVGMNICCTDDAHMIGMCDVAQLVRNNEHSLPVVEGCVKRFRVPAGATGATNACSGKSSGATNEDKCTLHCHGQSIRLQ